MLSRKTNTTEGRNSTPEVPAALVGRLREGRSGEEGLRKERDRRNRGKKGLLHLDDYRGGHTRKSREGRLEPFQNRKAKKRRILDRPEKGLKERGGEGGVGDKTRKFYQAKEGGGGTHAEEEGEETSSPS